MMLFNTGADMKTKNAKNGVSMSGGGSEDSTMTFSGMLGNGAADSVALKMPNDEQVGLADPNDRGMPGVSRRGPQNDMSHGRMDDGKSSSPADAMPAGDMGCGCGGTPLWHHGGAPQAVVDRSHLRAHAR
jgi:hypothetical protein